MNRNPIIATLCLSFLMLASLASLPPRAVLSQCPTCSYPSFEITNRNGSDTTLSLFAQEIGDGVPTNFDGRQVQERQGFLGSNSCYSPDYPDPGLPQYPLITGGTWTVGIWSLDAKTQRPGQHNRWGYDTIGWTEPGVWLVRTYGEQLGVTFPCGEVVGQNMVVDCPELGDWAIYLVGNVLSQWISKDPEYVCNSRSGVTSYIPYQLNCVPGVVCTPLQSGTEPCP